MATLTTTSHEPAPSGSSPSLSAHATGSGVGSRLSRSLSLSSHLPSFPKPRLPSFAHKAALPTPQAPRASLSAPSSPPKHTPAASGSTFTALEPIASTSRLEAGECMPARRPRSSRRSSASSTSSRESSSSGGNPRRGDDGAPPVPGRRARSPPGMLPGEALSMEADGLPRNSDRRGSSAERSSPSPERDALEHLLARLPSFNGLATLKEWRAESGERLSRMLSSNDLAHIDSTAKPSYRPSAGKTAIQDTLRNMVSLPSVSLPSIPSLSSLTPALVRQALSLEDPHGHEHEHEHDEEDSADDEAEADAELDALPLRPDDRDAIGRLTGDVVMLGGYRGSILRDARTNKRLWFSFKVASGIHKPDLSLGLAEEDERDAEKEVVPDKMLTTLLGWLDSGRTLQRRLRAMQRHAEAAPAASAAAANLGGEPGARSARVALTSFGYDWRLNLFLSSEKLKLKLVALKAASAARGEGPDGQGEGATVFAHSMGGLVVLHALATAADPSIFKAIVFAGTPFHGCINILGPLRLGDGEISSPSIAFSLRSAFYFLPFDGRCFERTDGSRIDLDLHDPKVWSDYGLSPVMEGILDEEGPEKDEKRARARRTMQLSKAKAWLGIGAALDAGLPIPGQSLAADEDPTAGSPEEAVQPEKSAVDRTSDKAIVDYFERQMAHVKQFWDDIHAGFDPLKYDAGLYPRVAVIASDTAPTVRGAIATSADKIKRAHKDPFKKMLFHPGDGVVLYDSARTLPGEWDLLRRGTVHTKNGHVCLLSDMEAVKTAVELVEPPRVAARSRRGSQAAQEKLDR